MKYIIFAFIALTIGTSCSKELHQTTNNSPLDLYDEFWTHVDRNYIYFDEKNVDWDSIYNVYTSQITELTSEEELLDLMEASLNELKDSHNSLRSNLRPSKGYNYRTEVPHFFSLELIQNSYFDSTLEEDGNFSYGIFQDSTFYVHVSKMQNIAKLQKLLRSQFNTKVKNIVIDLRDNSGGNSNDVPQLLGDYVSEKTYLGGYIEKSGPAREDETPAISVYANPSDEFKFDGKVYVLINHVCFSATSYFAAMAKGLDNFSLIGQKTGGGGGGNAGFEISNGWQVLISVSDFVDKEGVSIEYGVQPDVVISNEHFIGEQDSDVVFEKLLKVMK